MENIKDYIDFQRAVRELEGPWYADSNCVFFDKDTNTFRAFYQPDPNQPAELEIRFNPATQKAKFLNGDKEEEILLDEAKDRTDEKLLYPFLDRLHQSMRHLGVPFEADKNDPSYVRYELYADASEVLISEDVLCQMISSVDSKDDETACDIFNEYLDNSAANDGVFYYDTVIGNVLESLFSKKNYSSEEEMAKDQKIYQIYKSVVDDEILSHVIFFYDPKPFYQAILVDMMVDVGNRNFCNNCDDLLADTNSPERLERSSLLYLAELQGEREELTNRIEDYKKWSKKYKDGCAGFSEYDDLYLQGKSEFIRSALRELTETASYPVTTTILASITLDDLINILSDKKLFTHGYLNEEPYLTICSGKSSAPDATIGLYDPLNGAGGPFEIKLDKAIKIPLRCIDFEADNISRCYSEYSVDEAYGMCSSVWTDCVIYESPTKAE